MTRLAKKISILVVLVAVVAPASALAQSNQPEPAQPPNGRNFAGARIDASVDPYRSLHLLSMRAVDGGNSLNVWLLSLPRGCGGHFEVGTRKVPIDGQGRFSATLPFGDSDGSATVVGQFLKPRRGAIFARTTIHSKITASRSCETGDLRTKAISPSHGRRGAGRPAPNALFVGVTEQSSSRIGVKLPMLALISRDGTEVKRFLTNSNVPCKSGRNAGGIFRIRDIDIEGNSFEGVTGNQRPVPGTDQKRTIVLNAKGTFGERRLSGTWQVREIQTDPYGNTTDDCNTAAVKYVAARVR